MFYVIKKAVEGVYLLNPKNEVLFSSKNVTSATNFFNDNIENKGSLCKLVLCEKPDDYANYLHILLEK